MNRYLLIAGGVDRRGVVKALTGILKQQGFNIEDSSMIMLRHTFSMIMILTNKKKADASGLLKRLSDFGKEFDMTLDIRTITEKEMKEYVQKGENCVISISGADKPGIVNSITSVIASLGGNITGLTTKSSQSVKPSVYYMFLEVDMPKSAMKESEKKLKAAAKKLGVHININRENKEIL